MAKKKNIDNKPQQLKIDFEVVEKVIVKSSTEAKIISINTKKTFGQINSILKDKIFRDVINNSKSH